MSPGRPRFLPGEHTGHPVAVVEHNRHVAAGRVGVCPNVFEVDGAIPGALALLINV